MQVQFYNPKEIEYNLRQLGIDCEFINNVHLPTATLYQFKVNPIRFTLGKLKTAILRLGLFMGVEIEYKLTAYGFYVKIERAEKFYPTFSEFDNFTESNIYQFPLGVDDNGEKQFTALDDCVHLLVAGQTGSGKSVFLNSLIASLICNNDNIGLLLVDVKKVEFAKWKNSTHLSAPIITEVATAEKYLKWAVMEMENRYEVLSRLGKEKDDNGLFPKIVIIIDELADLMLQGGKDIEELLVRLAQKSRACGIHLVLATQRPTANVVTGLIKANMPTRIAFSMASYRDSLIMLDHKGAEDLKGKGDCIIQLPNGSEFHVQAPLITSEDIDYILS